MLTARIEKKFCYAGADAHLLLPHKPFVLSWTASQAYAPVSTSGRYVLYNLLANDQRPNL